MSIYPGWKGLQFNNQVGAGGNTRIQVVVRLAYTFYAFIPWHSEAS